MTEYILGYTKNNYTVHSATTVALQNVVVREIYGLNKPD